MRVDPLGVMRDAMADLGDAVYLKLGPYTATLFRNPEHIQRIFIDNAANYTKQTRGYQKSRLVLGEGLVTSEGELWKRQRRIATPAFHRQRVAGFAATMTHATGEALQQWTQNVRRGDGVIDAFEDLMRLTLRIAVETLLGVGPSPELDAVSGAVTDALERTNDIITNPFALPVWWPGPKMARFRRSIQTLDDFVYKTIARRRAEPPEDGASVEARGPVEAGGAVEARGSQESPESPGSPASPGSPESGGSSGSAGSGGSAGLFGVQRDAAEGENVDVRRGHDGGGGGGGGGDGNRSNAGNRNGGGGGGGVGVGVARVAGGGSSGASDGVRAGKPRRPDDILSMLLAARDNQTGLGMSDKQLRDEAVTILIAGHETTANALTWAMYLLGENPRWFAWLREELAAILPAGRVPGAEDVAKLPRVRATVDEAMRLYPPAWMIGRAATHDDTIGPYAVKGGEFVLVSPYMTHRHPGLWDNPDGFDPTRFLDGRSAALPKFAFVPFGGGQRFCIGSNFATLQATLMLAMIVQHFDWTLPADQTVKPFAMITLRPKNGVKVRLRGVC